MNRLVLAGILAAILAASGGMAGTLAAQGGGTACRHAACGNYVDDYGDGVCDAFERSRGVCPQDCPATPGNF